MGRPSKYPDEFRDEAVRLATAARAAGRPIAQTASELGINAQTLYNWLHAAQVESGDRQGLTKAERAELAELRKKVKRLEQEREILGKATLSSTGHCNTRSSMTAGV